MEQNKPTSAAHESTEDIVEKAKQNKKTIMQCLAGLAVVVVVALGWILIAQSGSEKADELIGKADIEQNDSIATALYAEAAKAGYKSGNRAAAEMGIRLFKKGEYQKAIEYLNDCSLDGAVAAPGVYALKGDCYANLDQLDEAISCYKKGVSAADENPEIVPFLLVKQANIFRVQGKHAEEAAAYKTIIDEYPTYANSTRVDINRLYERALAQK